MIVIFIIYLMFQSACAINMDYYQSQPDVEPAFAAFVYEYFPRPRRRPVTPTYGYLRRRYTWQPCGES